MCPSVNGSVGFCHLINGIGIDASLVDEAGLVVSRYQRGRLGRVL